jgi:hypothetical protein
MTKPTNKNINKIIDMFGGGSAMARDLTDIGYQTYPGQISQWKSRKSIPKTWWIPIAEAAEKKGLDLTLADIMKADLL